MSSLQIPILDCCCFYPGIAETSGPRPCRAVLRLVALSCPTHCDPRDCSLPGSSVYGILQARILEWVVISFSLGSSQPRDQTCISEHLLHQQVGSLPLASPGKPTNGIHDFVLFWLNSSPLCTYTSLKPIDF